MTRRGRALEDLARLAVSLGYGPEETEAAIRRALDRPVRVRGHRADRVIVDEAQQLPEPREVRVGDVPRCPRAVAGSAGSACGAPVRSVSVDGGAGRAATYRAAPCGHPLTRAEAEPIIAALRLLG